MQYTECVLFPWTLFRNEKQKRWWSTDKTVLLHQQAMAAWLLFAFFSRILFLYIIHWISNARLVFFNSKIWYLFVVYYSFNTESKILNTILLCIFTSRAIYYVYKKSPDIFHRFSTRLDGYYFINMPLSK